MTEYRLFLGNPGVGKSTLLNCLVGRPVFRAGLSFGTGLTVERQEFIADDGIMYMDTPGLADVAIRKRAAEEIQAALRKGGVYKLFFVAVLRNGRVSPEDITTFNQVVKAIDVPNLEFAVIINNVKPRQFKMISGNEEYLQKIFAAVNAMDVKTTSITLVPVLSGLEEEDNALVPLSANFVDFLNAAPSVHIPRDRVRDIDTDMDKYAQQLAEMQETLNKVLQDNRDLNAKIQELENRKPGFRDSLSQTFNAITRGLTTWF